MAILYTLGVIVGVVFDVIMSIINIGRVWVGCLMVSFSTSSSSVNEPEVHDAAAIILSNDCLSEMEVHNDAPASSFIGVEPLFKNCCP